MTSASATPSDGTWFVLIEQDDEVAYADGHDIFRWQLAAEHEARDEAHAREWAKDLLQTHLPTRRHAPADRPHTRRIYQSSENVWLVVIQESWRTQHFRLSVARLVGRSKVAAPPEPAQPEKRRRRLFG
ncbi:hypothetical protein LG634_09340 [Streptomyces bambusae]|uniref:hypothetical protein n=1 Tax=Streptomyces bambusae TaxID=1550616 RepID=UPI001CFC6057|nr:hypothetical protein [Streptomyces bambusae]MCB5165030.1 hypothetical protein [Streptomyces bambusae]